MPQFKKYVSKPFEREAFQIGDGIIYYRGEHVKYEYNGVMFKANQTPVKGDWVTKAPEGDVYHVPDAIFRELIIVPEGE